MQFLPHFYASFDSSLFTFTIAKPLLSMIIVSSSSWTNCSIKIESGRESVSWSSPVLKIPMIRCAPNSRSKMIRPSSYETQFQLKEPSDKTFWLSLRSLINDWVKCSKSRSCFSSSQIIHLRQSGSISPVKPISSP